ncbi:MAG: hypothetical protein IJ506_08520 [Clostridia bacterium]|nr:hypothetical protein [Clostridia bacterium]
MIINKANTLIERDVLVESVHYYMTLPKKTDIVIDEDTTVIVEQDGVIKGSWRFPAHGGGRNSLKRIAPTLKGSFLFGKMKNVTLHFLNNSEFEVSKQVQAKSATGIPCTFSGKLYFSVDKIDIRKLQKWIRDNNFKTNGSILLTVSQIRNVVSNLLFERGFEYVVGKTRVNTTSPTFTMTKANSASTFVEIADYIQSNCDRFGFESLCLVEPV